MMDRALFLRDDQATGVADAGGDIAFDDDGAAGDAGVTSVIRLMREEDCGPRRVSGLSRLTRVSSRAR